MSSTYETIDLGRLAAAALLGLAENMLHAAGDPPG
jgi:hypothetical protein